MSEKVVYLNGAFVPESEARVSVFDWGFRYREGVRRETRLLKIDCTLSGRPRSTFSRM